MWKPSTESKPNQLTSQPISEPLNQSTNFSPISKPLNQSTNLSANNRTSQPFNQLFPPTNLLTYKYSNQPTNHLVNVAANQPHEANSVPLLCHHDGHSAENAGTRISSARTSAPMLFCVNTCVVWRKGKTEKCSYLNPGCRRVYSRLKFPGIWTR